MPGFLRREMPEVEGTQWLVEGLLARGRTTTIFSQPGTGKTSLVCTLLPALQLGGHFAGLKIHGQELAALYLDFDDNWANTSFVLEAGMRGGGILLGRPEDGEEFAATKHLYEPGKKLMHDNTKALGMGLQKYVVENTIDVVIVDPLAGILHGDVNASGETRKALQEAFDPVLSHGCAVLLLDHTAKTEFGKKTPTGSGAKTGFVRIEAYLEPTKGGPQTDTHQALTLTCTKSNAKKFSPVNFTLVREENDKGELYKLTLVTGPETAPKPLSAPLSPQADARDQAATPPNQKEQEAIQYILERLQIGKAQANELYCKPDGSSGRDGTRRNALNKLVAEQRVKQVERGVYALSALG